MKATRLLLAACFCFSTGAALAHSDEYFDANASPHGGQVRMAGAYHFELVVQPGVLTVYVTDHAENTIATEGARALALVDSAGGKSEIKLEPSGDNRLSGKGEFALHAAMRVELTVTMPNDKPQSARFTPLKRKRK